MINFRQSTLALTVVLIASQAGDLFAHCEVPCGIYADQRRFEMMLEDQATIAKASAQINELIKVHNAQVVNQAVRWINTKEAHATSVQKIISQYFMTQRIKPGTEGYTQKLTAAHAVMVAAMKCKQNATAETAASLEKSIKNFHLVYEGKAHGAHDHGHGHKHGHDHKHKEK